MIMSLSAKNMVKFIDGLIRRLDDKVNKLEVKNDALTCSLGC